MNDTTQNTPRDDSYEAFIAEKVAEAPAVGFEAPQPQQSSPAAPAADRPGVVRALPQEAAEVAPEKPAKAPRKPREPRTPKEPKAPRGTTAVYIPGETTDAKAGAA